MYGIVNQAIKGLLTETYGVEKWEMIRARAGVEHDYFISNEPYDDDLTFDLVASAAEILELDVSEILKPFGHYWIMRTGNEKYGDLMKAGGANFFEFMHNLPNFHGRIMLIYPNLNPPEFNVEFISENTLQLDYYSTRKGLTYFVYGLIEGVAEMFSTSINIRIVHQSFEEVSHDVFHIEILEQNR